MTGKFLLAAGAAAIALGLAGGAGAQSIGGRASPQATTPGPATAAPETGATVAPVAPPANLDGTDVLDIEGDKVGEVKGAIGDRLIVSVGGFLGIGARQVSIPAERLNIAKVGDKVTVTTTLTRDELKSLPEYDAPATGR